MSCRGGTTWDTLPSPVICHSWLDIRHFAKKRTFISYPCSWLGDNFLDMEIQWKCFRLSLLICKVSSEPDCVLVKLLRDIIPNGVCYGGSLFEISSLVGWDDDLHMSDLTGQRHLPWLALNEVSWRWGDVRYFFETNKFKRWLGGGGGGGFVLGELIQFD